MSVLIETTLGDMTVDLFVKERPNATKNFLKLCKLKYYNLNQIFLIEPNYIAQTGDPTNTGRGGESLFGILYGDQARYFEMEMVPKMRHTRRGLISMVNNGNNMLGSQFFLTLDDNLDYLDGKHCIIGEVVEGLDTVQKINEELVDDSNFPYKDIRISHTIVIHDPFNDPPHMPTLERSPTPTDALIRLNTKIALDEAVDETEGKTAEEIKKEMEEKEMRAQAQILEMVGDLHHADERPPDNVLFVCKLNPATSDEDLNIIFSRFGTIVCCEVIRDRRTGDSLQYAFIEFEKPEYCEAAFLKMDNILIDDRRIHVDFSQSVAKNFQWKRQTDKDDVIKKEPSNTDQGNKISNKRAESGRLGFDEHQNVSPEKRHRKEIKRDSPSGKHHKRQRSRSVEKTKRKWSRSTDRSNTKHSRHRSHRSRSTDSGKRHKRRN